MKGNGLRIRGAVIAVALLALLAVPTVAYAVDVDTSTPIIAEDSTEADALTTAQQPDSDAADAPGTDASPDTGAEVGAEADAPQDTVQSSAGSMVSSQASADTKRAIEALLKARKAEYDATVARMLRSINQLAATIRRLDDAGVNTYMARRRLSEARTALSQARALERIAVARYRSVLTAEDEAEAYAAARTAARASSAQLERARVKLLTATRTLRAIVKNATVQNVGASTGSA